MTRPRFLTLLLCLALPALAEAQQPRMMMLPEGAQPLPLANGQIAFLADGETGVEVAAVVGDPEAAPDPDGFRSGDRITALDGDPVANLATCLTRVEAAAPGQTLHFGVLRDGEQRVVLHRVTAPEPSPGAGAGAGAGFGWVSEEEEPSGLTIAGYRLEADDAERPRVALVTAHEANGAIDLRVGDVVTTVDGRQVSTPEELRAALEAADADLRLVVLRRGQAVEVAVPRRALP